LDILACSILGYLVGTLNPAAWLARLKKINLRKLGTHNLGATNTLLILGKGWGFLVMLFDIVKAYVVSKLAAMVFVEMAFAGILAGFASVVGHVFPFYMKFKGGKGLAAYGGMVLAYSPMIFMILLVVCVIFMLIFNYGVALPISAAILFPVLTVLHTSNAAVILIAVLASLLILVMNVASVCKARRHEVIKVRDYICGRGKDL